MAGHQVVAKPFFAQEDKVIFYQLAELNYFKKNVNTLSKKYPCAFPESPAAIDVSSELAPSDYPNTLAAHAFKSTEIKNLPRASLQETELTKYQHHPELLQRETFV